MPITNASDKRRFSKLKLIKNYLWTTVVQEILSDLAIMSIGIEIYENLDYGDLKVKFSKARTINFV